MCYEVSKQSHPLLNYRISSMEANPSTPIKTEPPRIGKHGTLLLLIHPPTAIHFTPKNPAWLLGRTLSVFVPMIRLNNLRRAYEHHQGRQQARRDFFSAQEALRTCPASELHAARTRLEQSRRRIMSFSGGVPTASDEDIGRVCIFPYGRNPSPARPATAQGHNHAATADDLQGGGHDSSSSEYHSTSSTSSGGSSALDLDTKQLLWMEYLEHPAEVLTRYRALGPSSAGPVTESSTERTEHNPTCGKMRDRMAHCDCSLRQARLARRRIRKEGRVSRWFARQRAEAEGAEADDEAEVNGEPANRAKHG
jgi:hypothetical protein